MENNVGLPHLALLGLWALESLSFIVFQLILDGLAHWALSLFPISLDPSKAPHPFFLSLEVGYLTMASFSTLPMGQCDLFLVLMGISSFWAFGA